MTTQEQLKIFAAYLPYGLKVKHSDYEREIDSICNVVSITRDEITIMNSEHEYVCNFDDVRPILYDLSFLTKEIEHEGERFVPIVELLKIEFPNQKGRYAETDFSADGHPSAWFKVDAGKNIRVDVSRLNNAPYWMVRKLLYWHLNVFGIPAGDFIDKATIKTESPYT